MRRQLLAWFEANQRELPWREDQNPYRIWVSEVMLQQTRVAVVVERFRQFMQSFPTLLALALADEQQVLALWSGLGYYRRARMLHKAAQFVAENCSGNLPRTAAELRQLPGIGTYTAAAIASIAHGEPVAVVDGNVERVICRLAGWPAPARQGAAAQRRQIANAAQQLLAPRHAGQFNQAMMELGALLCTPKSPGCVACPLVAECITRGEHQTAARPQMKSVEVGHALAVRISPTGSPNRAHAQREVLLEQRPATETVMGGLWQLPVLASATVPEQEQRMTVRHAIMQVNYYVRVRTVVEEDVDQLCVIGGQREWVALNKVPHMALTGLARKVLKRAKLME